MAIQNKLTIDDSGSVSLRVLMPLRFDSNRVAEAEDPSLGG
jgi:hypothetical protein